MATREELNQMIAKTISTKIRFAPKFRAELESEGYQVTEWYGHFHNWCVYNPETKRRVCLDRGAACTFHKKPKRFDHWEGTYSYDYERCSQKPTIGVWHSNYRCNKGESRYFDINKFDFVGYLNCPRTDNKVFTLSREYTDYRRTNGMGRSYDTTKRMELYYKYKDECKKANYIASDLASANLKLKRATKDYEVASENLASANAKVDALYEQILKELGR